jgi:hypothetical protein
MVKSLRLGIGQKFLPNHTAFPLRRQGWMTALAINLIGLVAWI